MRKKLWAFLLCYCSIEFHSCAPVSKDMLSTFQRFLLGSRVCQVNNRRLLFSRKGVLFGKNLFLPSSKRL